MTIAFDTSAGSHDGTVDLLRGLDALEASRDLWWTLWCADAQATPMQSPAWLLSWARHFAPDRAAALVLRERGEPVALLPCFAWRGCMLLAGTGPGDYGDGVFARAARADDDATRLLAALAAHATEESCEVVDLRQLRPSSPLLRAATPAGWSNEVIDDDTCPVARLSGDDGLAAASPRWRANAARALRRWHERDVAVDAVTAPDAAAAALERLHGQRWRGRGETGVLAGAAMRGFVHDAIAALHAAGLLRFHTLRVRADDRALAVVFAMQHRHAAYFYLCGFDPAWSRLSPGLVTVAAAMRAAAAEGAREFHFLRGREDYKYRLGAQDRPTRRRTLRRAAACASAAGRASR